MAPPYPCGRLVCRLISISMHIDKKQQIFPIGTKTNKTTIDDSLRHWVWCKIFANPYKGRVWLSFMMLLFCANILCNPWNQIVLISYKVSPRPASLFLQRLQRKGFICNFLLPSSDCMMPPQPLQKICNLG